MAGFWSGFGKGFSEGLDRNERRRQFEETLKEKRRDTLLQLGAANAKRTSRSGRSSTGGSSEDSAKLFASGRFLAKAGVDEDLVASLVATQDLDAVESLVDNVRDVQTKYAELGEEIPEGYFNEALENSVTVSPQRVEYDPKTFYSNLGINIEGYDFTPEEMAIMGAGSYETIPGAAVTPEISGPQEVMSPSEIANITEQLVQPSLDLARKEYAGYKRMMVDLQEGGPLYEDLGGDSDTVEYFLQLASERALTLEQVLTQAKEESYTSLLDMYGQNAFKAYDEYYNLTARGVPMPYLGDGSTILKLPSGQEEYFDHVLGSYGITNYEYYTPE